MPEPILMPELGESVHEGTVGRWLKKVGDAVKEDEPVVEIMTDKVNTELQAPTSGVLLEIRVPEGGSVKVFEPLGFIGKPEEAKTIETRPSPEAPKATAEQPVRVEGTAKPEAPTATPSGDASQRIGARQVTTPGGGDGRRWYTPVVKSIAKEHGVSAEELAAIQGSGERGRVTKRDLEAYLERRSIPSPAAASPPRQAVPSADQEVVTLTGMRKAIADAMTRAHQIPSVSTVTEVDVSRLVEFRKLNKESFQTNYGVKLTYTPFFIKAAVEALLEFPVLNGSLSEDGRLIINHAVHMGVAVALGDGSEGLIVPVIRDAHTKNLIEIAKELDSLGKRARENKLDLPSIQGATCTITNPGSYGALFGTPMIPPGQAAIVGTYAIKDSPVVVDGMLAIRPVMYLVLSYDHRIIDGMLAGRFLRAMKDRLEAFDFFR